MKDFSWGASQQPITILTACPEATMNAFAAAIAGVSAKLN